MYNSRTSGQWFKGPSQPLIIRLSLVSIELCVTNYINTRIFCGMGKVYHIKAGMAGFTPLEFKKLYKDLVVNFPV